jgi:hypothetical protein
MNKTAMYLMTLIGLIWSIAKVNGLINWDWWVVTLPFTLLITWIFIYCLYIYIKVIRQK